MGHFPKKFVSLMFYCSRFGLRSTRDLSRFDRFEKTGACRTAQARHDLPLSIQQSLGSFVKEKKRNFKLSNNLIKLLSGASVNPFERRL